MMRILPIMALWFVSSCTGHEPNPTIFAHECEQCHLNEYESASDPIHVEQKPLKCVACHPATDAWIPEDHSRHDNLFRISNGNHRRLDCEDCHPPTALPEYFEFTCMETCHEHNKSKMDGEHSGVGGYAYQAIACLTCHEDWER